MITITEPIIRGVHGSVEISSPLTSTTLTIPLSQKPIASPDGKQIVFRGITLRDMFLMKLKLIESSTLVPEEIRKEAKMVGDTLSTVVKEIHIDYGHGKANPAFTFEIEDINQYKTSRFTEEERLQLQAIDEQINQLASQNQMVPPSLINERNELNKRVGERGSVGDSENVSLIYSMYKHCVGLDVTEYALKLIHQHSDDVAKVYKPKTKKPRVRPTASSKSATFRRAGHLVDQTLKVDKYIDASIGGLPLDPDRAKAMLDLQGKTADDVMHGIQLSGSEQKFIDCLCQMLHEKSQTTTPTEHDYYAGNHPPQLVPYGSVQELAPTLGFTVYELAKAYLGDQTPSGQEMGNVRNVLKGLLTKEFFISYSWIVNNGTKQKRYTISEFATLVTLKNLSVEDLEGDVVKNQNDVYVVGLNPIFRHQIASKFVETPSDIIARTITASGKSKIPASTTKLRDYLLRARGLKQYSQSIYEDRLFRTLCPEMMEQGRRRRAGDYTKTALETMMRLGLLLKWELVPGATGQPKFNLTLNKDWK